MSAVSHQFTITLTWMESKHAIVTTKPHKEIEKTNFHIFEKKNKKSPNMSIRSISLMLLILIYTLISGQIKMTLL